MQFRRLGLFGINVFHSAQVCAFHLQRKRFYVSGTEISAVVVDGVAGVK